MTQNSGDLRARRTRKLLRDALLELIEEHGFDAITVGEIAERAMVSRAAFYRYYKDKYDLVEQIFDAAMQVLVSDVGQRSHDNLSGLDLANEPTPERWVKLFEHFTEYERMYRVLLSGKGSPWFAKKMRTSLAEMRSEHQPSPSSNTNGKHAAGSYMDAEGLVPTLVDALIIDTVTWWLEQGRPYPPRQIATYCWHLIIALIKEARTWK